MTVRYRSPDEDEAELARYHAHAAELAPPDLLARLHRPAQGSASSGR